MDDNQKYSYNMSRWLIQTSVLGIQKQLCGNKQSHIWGEEQLAMTIKLCSDVRTPFRAKHGTSSTSSTCTSGFYKRRGSAATSVRQQGLPDGQ